jgi:hypothetical protein
LAFGGNHRAERRFPELRPVLDAPEGYTWEFRNGEDFYVWVLADQEMVGDRHRSGVGIYFGHHPDLSAATAATEKVAGRVAGKKVTWLVDRNEAGPDPWVRRDATLEYDHGPGFLTIVLHVWVWGQSEEQVAGLAARLEGLSFVDR